MTDFLDVSVRDLLFWSGVGGIVIPLFCHTLRRVFLPDATDDPRDPKNPVDQLQGIEGIGPEISGVLSAAGVTSFAAIAAKTPEQLKVILTDAGSQFQLADTATWPPQAALLQAGDIEGFLKLAIKLTAGVTILENIDGIGEGYGERLRLGGINTVAKLASATPDAVADAIGANGAASRGEIDDWIGQAKAFVAGNRTALAELAGNLQRATLPAAAASVLAGPADTSPRDQSMPGVNAPPRWSSENAVLACTTTLGALLLIGSLIPPPKHHETVDRVHRFERDCTLTGKTTFPASALFLQAKSRFSPDGELMIGNFVSDLKGDAALRKDNPDAILAIGYASDEGSETYNQALSVARAKTVADRLRTELNWPSTLFKFAGKGESEAQPCYRKPLAERESCRVPDRKIEVLVAYGTVNPQSAQRSCGDWREVPASAPAGKR